MPPASRGLFARPARQIWNLHTCRACRGVGLNTKRYLASQPPPPPPPKPASSLEPPQPLRAKILSSSAPSRSPAPPLPPSSQTSGLEDKEKPKTQRRFFRQRFRPNRFIKSFFAFAITLPLLGFALDHAPFTWHRVKGPSMNPTFNPTCYTDADTSYAPAHVLVQKWQPNIIRGQYKRVKEESTGGLALPYERGQVVVYRTPHDPEKIAVKRVVGLPGDTVVPLLGYAGQEEGDMEAVVVPYNHLWVEGDVSDRRKSVDSNWFGPISQRLVVGTVLCTWCPWWNLLEMRKTTKNASNGDWPARRQGRVVENAVQKASNSPDHNATIEAFEGKEKAEMYRRLLDSHSETMKEKFSSDVKFRADTTKFWSRGLTVAKAHEDAEVRKQAKEIVFAMEQVFGRTVLERASNER